MQQPGGHRPDRLDQLGSSDSGYANCNIGQNGTDGLGHSCSDGTYCCSCEAPGRHHHFPPPSEPCNATVGRSNLYSELHSGSSWPSDCTKDYECWSSPNRRVGAKLTPEHPGNWYSPLSYGDCSLHERPTTNCTWRLKCREDREQAVPHTILLLIGATGGARVFCWVQMRRIRAGSGVSTRR